MMLVWLMLASADRLLLPPPAPSDASWEQCAQGSPARAIAACTRLIASLGRRDRNRALALFDRANAWRSRSRFELANGADAQKQSAASLGRALAEVWNNRALARLKSNRTDLAQPDFDQTIMLNKNYGNALILRALPSFTPPESAP